MATFVSSLEHKSNVELKNLKDKLKNQLNKDIFRIYSESIFTDIYISVGSNLVKLHRCFLQTRTPAFYHIFTHNPDLINIVPQQKLDFFLREIYCDSQIKTVEEDLVKCIETSFLTNSTSSLAASSDLELSNYFSINDSRTSDEPNKSHLLDLSKLNTSVSYNYFRRSDNSVYYSLVDESLILSDYSDINEEGLKEMSSRRECDDLIHIELQERRDVEKSISCDIEENNREGGVCEALTSSTVVEHLNVIDLSTENHDVANDHHNLKKEKKSKFFDVETSSTVTTRKGKSFKFFIDASDLIDNEETKESKTPKPPESIGIRSENSKHPDSLKFAHKSDAESQYNRECVKNSFKKRNDKQTPDSLDDIPEMSNGTLTQLELAEEKYESELQAKLQKDFYNANIADNCRVVEQKSCRPKCINITEEVSNSAECEKLDLNDTKTSTTASYSTEQLQILEKNTSTENGRLNGQNTVKVAYSLSIDEKIRAGDDLITNFTSSIKNEASENVNSFVAENPPISVNISSAFEHPTTTQDFVSGSLVTNCDFARFKMFLTEKYDCAIKNHAYSDDERERLKIFDKLIYQDKLFEYLKCNLEEIVNNRLNNKTQVAMHKFLVKQYEKKHGTEVINAFAKTLMHDILSKRTANKDDRPNDGDVIVDDVDELLRKLLLPIPKNVIPVKTSPQKCDEVLEPVSGKSCGFFIDLKENTKPMNKTLEKSLPPKQLFSMFIDFGNSTDSDSSIEVQNKFERRKKQYISKLEKSRELRSSVSSLNEESESRKLEKMTQNTTPSKGSHSVTEKTILDPVPTSNETLSVVMRRCKNGSPHPHELRRSWNIDKTNDINRNVITKHKRSYSVTSHKDIPLETVACPEDIPHINGEDEGNEFPSIGNADSTNELTANGESEMSNGRSYSEKENCKIVLASSVSNSNGVTFDQNQNQSSKVDPDIEEKKVFVKLSDMDKEPKTIFSNSDQWSSIRMTKSATGTEINWFETKLLNGSVNSRSLSRIFPDLSANVLSKPNSDVDDTTVSSISSIQSSSAVSTCESNLEMSNNVNKNDNNTLGQDLLRMFLDEISTDVVVEVAGRRIKAHKCILTSRCQYFAALLSGGWVESAGNVLSIQGFSYNVVHFALCYIYSGESEIPESINIVELATLADYLCLEGLKEIVSCTLKTKYCHFFHKPCNICSVGVLECLPIAVNYGLDDIHRKSLRWITKHYVRLWCSKAFATLPRELIDKCYNQHVVNMTVNNVFETLINCDKLFSFIPQTRWAEPCFVVTKKLHDYCIRFLANHFLEFLKSEAFTSIASTRTWGIMTMDEKTQLACTKMRSDQLCQGYVYLNSQCKLATASHESEELIELLNRVKNQVEAALVKTALQASQCSAWFQMEPELRSHIQNAAGLTFLPSELKRRVDSFKSRQPVPTSSGSRDADLQQVKSVINRQHKQSNIRSHEARPTKQNSNPRQSSTQSRNTSARQTGSQNKENKVFKAPANTNSKSPFRNKYANVKSRYMESKTGKSDRTASETTPSETSEVEKKPSTVSKRPSKSLASSVHLSPGIRQTARAVSLSKIPVSVRNSSQKRTESDKDTTSGSDNGFRGERTRARVNGTEALRSNKKLNTSVTTKTNSTSSRTNQPVMRKSFNDSAKPHPTDHRPKSDSKVNRIAKSQSTITKSRSVVNGCSGLNHHVVGNGVVTKHNNDSDDFRSKNRSPDTKDPSSNPSSKTSLSEEIPRPDIPFRRDGTFCIDEPTILKKHSPTSDQADIV